MPGKIYSYNPIQIAAISNFKLAQLTFAPPHLDSLRKTAIIKNTVERIYLDEKKIGLEGKMTRWQFFSAESLEKMTQEGLEEIFAEYASTMEEYRNTVYVEEDTVIEKPLPDNPSTKERRKSRLSWTSDTGLTSNVVSQNLANQIMSLFDMDFAVDIKIDTAPKLPELPFKPKVNNQRRYSQDMLTTLIPAFEKIAFENQRQLQTTTLQSVPKRSSSLKHRQGKISIKDKPLPSPPPITSPEEKKKCLPKKKKRSSAVIMEKSASKRKSLTFDSIYDDKNRPALTRSKSAFIKISGGLKSKKSTSKYVRKTSSANDFKTEYNKDEAFYNSPNQHNFVKRVASFMKSRSK